MAQTNFTPILTYKSDTATAVPSAGNLTNSANGAELAVNTADKRLFTKDSGGNVVELGTNPSSLTLPNSTANGVVYANGSKVLTTGSALSFNGTYLNANGLRIAGTDTSNTIYQATGSLVITADNSFLGLQANAGNPIIFYNNSTEQMRLTSTGLGIGTSSPTDKLHVVGLARINTGTYSAGYGLTFQANSETSRTYQMGMVTGGAFAIYDSAAAAQRVVLDASGNLGLGVTPSAWNTGFKALQIGAQGALWSSTSTAATWLTHNTFLNTSSSFRYLANSTANALQIDNDGAFKFYTAPSGTAGDAITFTQAMTLDSSGRLLIGGTSTYDFNGQANLVVNGTANNATITIASTDTGYLAFADGTGGTDRYTGSIQYLHSSNAMLFSTNGGVERARITSGGDLLVGTTSSSALSAVGRGLIELNGSSDSVYSYKAGGNLVGYTLGSASEIRIASFTAIPLAFYTNASERARITSGGDLLVGTTSNANNARSRFVASGIWCIETERETTGSATQVAFLNPNGIVGTISTSASTTAYNTSSDYRLKNITGPITTSGAYIDSLNPVEGTWKADGSTFVGLIAHEVQEASRTQVATGVKDGEEMQGMDYSSAEIIANLIAEVKALRTRVAALEAA